MTILAYGNQSVTILEITNSCVTECETGTLSLDTTAVKVRGHIGVYQSVELLLQILVGSLRGCVAVLESEYRTERERGRKKTLLECLLTRSQSQSCHGFLAKS